MPPDVLETLVENLAEALAQAVRRDLAAEAEHGTCLSDDGVISFQRPNSAPEEAPDAEEGRVPAPTRRPVPAARQPR
jgi:hypothetical protein